MNWPSEVPDEYREQWSNYQEVGLGLWAIKGYLNDQVQRCLFEGVADARELDGASDGDDVDRVAESLLAGGKDTLRVLIGNLYPVSIPTEGGRDNRWLIGSKSRDKTKNHRRRRQMLKDSLWHIEESGCES